MTSLDRDVVIVGCGPVGAYAANLLGRTGRRVLVVDQETAPYSLPRAVHFDHEMLRLLADVGLLDRVSGRMAAAHGHLHIGADNGVIRHLSAVGQPRPFGYANDYFFYQPELEQALRAGLARFANVEMRLGATVTGLEPVTDGVRLTFADGRSETASWVIGADGARSVVRKALGVGLADLEFEEPWLVVDAEVQGPLTFPDFTGLAPGADLQKLSVMMCNPQRPTTVVPGRGDHRRWEFMLLPGESDTEMAQPEKAGKLIAPWLAGTPHKVIRAATYRFHGLVAEHWRKGRCLLAGDAAHQTPPFFGQGLCHGMRDIANLGWKLDLVMRGAAGEALLDSYQIEREAQVRHVIGKAIEAGRYICILDPAAAAERDARVRAQKDIRTAAELIAPISSNLIGPRGGERFINPPVDASGRLLDSATGGGWVLLERKRQALSPEATAVLQVLDARRLTIGADVGDAEGHLGRWLDARVAEAVLVRPDFYVATAGDGDTFCAGLAEMGAALGLAAVALEQEETC